MGRGWVRQLFLRQRGVVSVLSRIYVLLFDPLAVAKEEEAGENIHLAYHSSVTVKCRWAINKIPMYGYGVHCTGFWNPSSSSDPAVWITLWGSLDPWSFFLWIILWGSLDPWSLIYGSYSGDHWIHENWHRTCYVFFKFYMTFQLNKVVAGMFDVSN